MAQISDTCATYYIYTNDIIHHQFPPTVRFFHPWLSTRPKLLCIPLGFVASPQAVAKFSCYDFCIIFTSFVSVEPIFYCYKVKSEHTKKNGSPKIIVDIAS